MTNVSSIPQDNISIFQVNDKTFPNYVLAVFHQYIRHNEVNICRESLVFLKPYPKCQSHHHSWGHMTGGGDWSQWWVWSFDSLLDGCVVVAVAIKAEVWWQLEELSRVCSIPMC